MKELIDRKALIAEYDRVHIGEPGKARKLMEDAPTVDAMEVVHGDWHIDAYDGGEPDGYAAFIEVHCSQCGYGLGAESGQYGWAYGDPFPLNYCPHCGAKMDGKS